jgi:hypothetical protein
MDQLKAEGGQAGDDEDQRNDQFGPDPSAQRDRPFDGVVHRPFVSIA